MAMALTREKPRLATAAVLKNAKIASVVSKLATSRKRSFFKMMPVPK